MVDLEEQLQSVATAGDLAELVAALADDLARDAEGWENATLPRYLEALAAWLRDQAGSPQRSAEPLDSPSWRAFGAALLAARVYE
jgi:hypothetical protein